MGKRSREASPPSSSPVLKPTTSPSQSSSFATHAPKLVAIEHECRQSDADVKCSLPPHVGAVIFSTLEDFEVHYIQEHTNRCVECGKNFPSTHILHLHIDENHNAIREALAAQGERTYACFVEDCERKCSTPQKRRLHLIDKHGFPKVYDFRVVDRGIDHSTTLLQEGRRRRVSVATNAGSSNQRKRSIASEPESLSQSPSSPPDHDKSREHRPDQQINDLDHFASEMHSSSGQTASQDTTSVLETRLSALRLIPRTVQGRLRQKAKIK